jgi:hypothetical protein
MVLLARGVELASLVSVSLNGTSSRHLSPKRVHAFQVLLYRPWYVAALVKEDSRGYNDRNP